MHKKRGLTQVTFEAHTSWSDATANVSRDVREEKPSGKLAAIETYSPPQPRPN